MVKYKWILYLFITLVTAVIVYFLWSHYKKIENVKPKSECECHFKPIDQNSESIDTTIYRSIDSITSGISMDMNLKLGKDSDANIDGSLKAISSIYEEKKSLIKGTTKFSNKDEEIFTLILLSKMYCPRFLEMCKNNDTNGKNAILKEHQDAIEKYILDKNNTSPTNYEKEDEKKDKTKTSENKKSKNIVNEFSLAFPLNTKLEFENNGSLFRYNEYSNNKVEIDFSSIIEKTADGHCKIIGGIPSIVCNNIKSKINFKIEPKYSHGRPCPMIQDSLENKIKQFIINSPNEFVKSLKSCL